MLTFFPAAMGPDDDEDRPANRLLLPRGYQQELLEDSLKRNLIIALDTGSGKTHIAVLRMKLEAERNSHKVSRISMTVQESCVNVDNLDILVSRTNRGAY